MTFFGEKYLAFFRNLKHALFIVLSFICLLGCKEDVDASPRILEQEVYKGVYSITRTELLGFEEDMKPIVKNDTFFFETILVDFTVREDSTFITSSAFAYQFVTEDNGASGESNSYYSTFTNAGTTFTRTDSTLQIGGYAQQGSRIQTIRKYNGIKQ